MSTEHHRTLPKIPKHPRASPNTIELLRPLFPDQAPPIPFFDLHPPLTHGWTSLSWKRPLMLQVIGYWMHDQACSSDYWLLKQVKLSRRQWSTTRIYEQFCFNRSHLRTECPIDAARRHRCKEIPLSVEDLHFTRSSSRASVLWVGWVLPGGWEYRIVLEQPAYIVTSQSHSGDWYIKHLSSSLIRSPNFIWNSILYAEGLYNKVVSYVPFTTIVLLGFRRGVRRNGHLLFFWHTRDILCWFRVNTEASCDPIPLITKISRLTFRIRRYPVFFWDSIEMAWIWGAFPGNLASKAEKEAVRSLYGAPRLRRREGGAPDGIAKRVKDLEVRPG